MGGMPLIVLQSLVASSFEDVYTGLQLSKITWGSRGKGPLTVLGQQFPKFATLLESTGDLLKILMSGSHSQIFNPFNPPHPSMQWAECLHLPPKLILKP